MGVNYLPWYYLEALKPSDTAVSLKGDEWHHCHNVLRLGEGDQLLLFNGIDLCMEGIIRKVSKYEGQIELISDRTSLFQAQATCNISIAFAPTKNIDRTEFAIEKLVELGVDEIILLECDHSERSHIRIDRLEKIILSASKQSRKVRMPAIQNLISPTLLTTQFKHDKPDTQVYCCHLDNTSVPLIENYSPHRDVLMLIGPEGGFSPEETEQLSLRGAKMVTLGPYRLRVETAAIAACNSIHILNALKKTP